MVIDTLVILLCAICVAVSAAVLGEGQQLSQWSFIDPADYDVQMVLTTVSYENQYEDFEFVPYWRYDNSSVVAAEVCKYLALETVGCKSHFRTLLAEHELSDVETVTNTHVILIRAALNQFTPTFRMSRFQFIVSLYETLAGAAVRPDAEFVMIDDHRDCLEQWYQLLSHFSTIADSPRSARFLSSTDFDSYFIHNPDEDFGNRVLFFSSCDRRTQLTCEHSDIPFRFFISQLDRSRDIISLPLKVCLIGYSEANDIGTWGLLSSIYGTQREIPGHVGSLRPMTCFSDVQHQLPRDIFIEYLEPRPRIAGIVEVPYCLQNPRPFKEFASASLNRRPLLKRYSEDSCTTTGGNCGAQLKTAFYGRSSYASHFPHWTLLMTWAFSTIRWSRQLGLPPVEFIIDRSGTGPGAHWIRQFRRRFRQFWDGEFLHDYGIHDINTLEAAHMQLNTISTNLESDNAWHDGDQWFMHPSDGRYFGALMSGEDVCDSNLFSSKYSSTFQLILEIEQTFGVNYASLANIQKHSFSDLLLKLMIKSHRLALVDRIGSRSILNWNEVIQYFYDITGDEVAEHSSLHSHVHYMHNKSFTEQVSLMRDTELLIIGHGAAVTNIVFMRPCSIALEIMPWGYVIPRLFGNLASDMGIIYKSLVTPNRPPSLEQVCPMAVNQDCQVGLHNLTAESFSCRSCVRTKGFISVDITELDTALREAAYEHGLCLLEERKRY
jgi:hypothetical protein